jgi:hypothetical protein
MTTGATAQTDIENTNTARFEVGQVLTFLGYSDEVVGVDFPVGSSLTVVQAYDSESDWYDGIIVEDALGRRDMVWQEEVRHELPPA